MKYSGPLPRRPGRLRSIAPSLCHGGASHGIAPGREIGEPILGKLPGDRSAASEVAVTSGGMHRECYEIVRCVMVDGEDSGRFKQVVPIDEEFVPGSVEESVDGTTTPSLLMTTPRQATTTTLARTGRSKSRSGRKPRRGCRGIAVLPGAAEGAQSISMLDIEGG